MDHKYIQDNQLVERYLQDKLTDEEKVAFEEYYLSNAETLAELELAEKMQDGFRGLEESEFFDKPATDGWFNRVFLSPQYAAAASILLVFSLGFSGILYRQQQADDAFYGTQVIPVLSVRSSTSGQPMDLTRIKQTDDWIVLLVDPGMESYASYRASVARVDGTDSKMISQLEDLQPGYEDLLAVGLPGAILQPGDYEIRLSGQAEATSDDFAEIRRLSFTVTQP
jgi:hypothetical protein